MFFLQYSHIFTKKHVFKFAIKTTRFAEYICNAPWNFYKDIFKIGYVKNMLVKNKLKEGVLVAYCKCFSLHN